MKLKHLLPFAIYFFALMGISYLVISWVVVSHQSDRPSNFYLVNDSVNI